MTAVKERIIGAVSIMSDKDANIFWHIIQKHFKLPSFAPRYWRWFHQRT